MHNPAILNLRTLVGVYLLCWLWIQNFTLQNVITAYECIINTRKQSIKVLWASIFPSNPDERGIVANCTLPTRGRDYGNALIKFPHCDFYPKNSSPMAPTRDAAPAESFRTYVLIHWVQKERGSFTIMYLRGGFVNSVMWLCKYGNFVSNFSITFSSSTTLYV